MNNISQSRADSESRSVADARNPPLPSDNWLEYNQVAWDGLVGAQNQWTIPVDAAAIANAKRGNWEIVLTPTKSVPRNWFPDFLQVSTATQTQTSGSAQDSTATATIAPRVLCLAGSGGQQAPILAAAGADVTVWDLSVQQLAQDRLVADREGLTLATIQGDMCDLSGLADESFDLIVHPCSNSFVPDVNLVWQEAARVLKPGGSLLAGFINPIFFLFDDALMEKGELKVVHSIPYSDLQSLTNAQQQKLIDAGEPFCFGHTLTDQIGGQLAAGLRVVGFYEDTWPDYVISQHIACFAATRAVKA